MQHLDSLNYFAADRSYFTPHTYPDLAPESAYSFADYLNTLQNLPQPPLSEPAIPAPEDDREFKEAQQYGAEKTTPHDKTDIPIKADGEEPGSAAAVKTFTAKSNSANETANEKPAPLSAAAANETANEKPAPLSAAAANKTANEKPAPLSAAAANETANEKPAPLSAAAANETANEKPAPLSAAAANETGNETANETGGAAGTVGTATSEKIVDATASADKNSVLEKNQSDPQNTMGNESFSNEEDENHFVDHKTDDRKISFLKQQKEPASGQAKSRHAATRQSSTRRPVSGQVSAHQVSAHQANRLEHNSEGASDIEHSAGNAEHSPLPALASSGDENQQGNREGGTFSNIMFQNTENNANPRNNTAEIQVFLVPDAQGAQGAANTSPDGIGGEAPARTMSSAEFMDQFRAQFRQQLGSDIVRHARYILRGQNAGEISLVLKPEKFGRVRIRMQLEDKSIDGKIFVENKYVKEAFVEVLDDLKQAFAEQGFDDLNVDINLEDESLGENLLAENTSSPSSQFQASHESHERELEAAQAYIREFDSVNILA